MLQCDALFVAPYQNYYIIIPKNNAEVYCRFIFNFLTKKKEKKDEQVTLFSLLE